MNRQPIIGDVRSMILQPQEWKDENRAPYLKALRHENEILKAAACWRFTLAARGMACGKCGARDGAGTVRFKRPISEALGLENEPENLMVLCMKCRNSK